MNFLKFHLPLFFLSFQLAAQHVGVKFQTAPAWENVLRQAQKEHKLIFLDAATSWCVPCKRMEKEVFSRKEAGEFFNQNFIPVQYDMDEGEGVSLKNQYGIQAFPTYLFLDWNGMVIHKIVGAHTGEGEFVGYARLALSPGDSYGALGARYRNGERSPAMMLKYMDALRLAGQEEQAKEIADGYLSLVSKDHFMDSSYWGIIQFLLKEPSSKEFKILFENRMEIAAARGEREVFDKIFSIFENEIEENRRYRVQEGVPFDGAAEDVLLEMLRQADDFSRANELYTRALSVRYERRKDWDNFAYVADAMLDFDLLKDCPEPLKELNRCAAVVLEKADDGRIFRRALRWAEAACQGERRPEILATYLKTKAGLLEKMGMSAEAAEARAAAETTEKNAKKRMGN